MLDFELRVFLVKNIGKQVEGKEVDSGGDEDADVRFARKVEDVEGVNVRIGQVADEGRLPAQIETVVAELARGRAPAPAYPTAVRVAVNPTVAQTLGVPAEAVARARALFSRP